VIARHNDGRPLRQPVEKRARLLELALFRALCEMI
jgi:hypothetical protein